MKKQCNLRPRQAGTIAGAVAALFAASWAPSLLANPTGAQVVSGSVSINSPGGGKMNITQTTPNAIVNWNTFSIGSGEAVTIAQPSALAALLNRVTGNDPSVIAGRLQANGKVFLVNPAGAIFAPGSSVNVGSLIASTLNISNADFLAGNYHFVGTSPAAVTNAGSLTAQSGGTITLLGGTVSNTGTVSARLGTVALGAGSDITVDFAGDGLTTLKINQGAVNALIGNTGTLAADGGTVIMSSQTADALAGTVINQQGIVRAQSLTEHNGRIVLDGGTNGVTQVGGTLDATGGAGLTGGQVDVTGYDVALLDGARVDASGAAGGGTVRFGGGAAGQDPTIRNANAIWMAPTASLHADALVNGNGGNVVAFSQTASRIYGTLTAKGGPQGGNGGLIETSGHYLDTTGATIDASAPNGSGGTWLLDPDDIDIVSSLPRSGTPATEPNGSATLFTPAGALSYVLNSQITGELNQGNSVTITTAGDPNGGNITIQAPINVTLADPTKNPTLTLNALGSINDTGQNIMTLGGPLNLVFHANSGAPGGSAVTLNSVMIDTNGGSIDIEGNRGAVPSATGTGSSGIIFDNATLTTESGAVQLYGEGVGPTFVCTTFSAYGIEMNDSTISTTSGTIDIRGDFTGTVVPNTKGIGVNIQGSTIEATAPGTSISIAGSSTSVSYSGLGAKPFAGVQITTDANGKGSTIKAGPGGSVVLRAMNDNSAASPTPSLKINGAVISSSLGVLSILPGGVSNTFAFTSGDALPIDLFTPPGAGMSIDAPTFGQFHDFQTIILGSTTQTGLITVDCASSGSTCSRTTPLGVNLTLLSPGSGSQGIQLPSGLSVGTSHTLSLVSGGPVTDPGGIQAASLLLSGPGDFTLTDPQNDVGVLAIVNAGNVNFLDSHGFTIGPVVAQTFNTSSGALATIDGTNSTLTGNLVAQAAIGNIGLDAGLSAGGTVDLVMENGVFNAGSSGALSATNGWRIWASTWNQEVRGNVQPNTPQPNFYGCTYGVGCSWPGTVPMTGDHYVYLERPTVTVTADGKIRLLFAPNPTFTVMASGLINGDTAAGALSGTVTSPATEDSPVGTYPINPNFTSRVGYIVNEVPGTLAVVHDPFTVTYPPVLVVSDPGTFVYENNLQGTNICVGSNQPLFTTAAPGEKQDLLSVEWKRVRSQPNLNSCLLLNGEHGCGDF